MRREIVEEIDGKIEVIEKTDLEKSLSTLHET